MILVAHSRQLHVKDVLAHPLSPLPWALANADVSLRKTNKAALARELERNVSPAEDIPDSSTCIIDGMSLVQRMNGNNKTFAQLAKSLMSLVLHDGSQSHQIDVVFDVYRDTSIKHGHNIQQWRKFLCSSCNKSSLIKLILEQWKLPKCREKPHDKLLYVTCEEVC